VAKSKAIAAYRGARALELSLAGWSYDAITAELGYKSRDSVSKAMWKAIDRRSAEGVEENRALELSRLDALQAAHWDRAVDGDTKAAEVVLNVIEKRCRLLGLDRPGKAAAGAGSVIAPGHEETYAAVLAEAQGGKPDGVGEG
jgi:hypothetical protein